MRNHLCTAIAVIGATLVGSALHAEDKQGFLGVGVAPGDDSHGVIVRHVMADSPADHAGLKIGDRIMKLGDREAKNVDAFMAGMDLHKPGDKVTVTIQRGGKEEKLTATLADSPTTLTQRAHDGHTGVFLGVMMQPITAELRAQAKLDTQDGAFIADVIPDSPAAKAGIKYGDVITAIGGNAVKNPEDLRDAIQKVGAKEVAVAVARGTEKLNLKATPQAGNVSYFEPQGPGRFTFLEGTPIVDPGQRIRQLERRIEELEKQLKESEHRK